MIIINTKCLLRLWYVPAMKKKKKRKRSSTSVCIKDLPCLILHVLWHSGSVQLSCPTKRQLCAACRSTTDAQLSKVSRGFCFALHCASKGVCPLWFDLIKGRRWLWCPPNPGNFKAPSQTNLGNESTSGRSFQRAVVSGHQTKPVSSVQLDGGRCLQAPRNHSKDLMCASLWTLFSGHVIDVSGKQIF